MQTLTSLYEEYCKTKLVRLADMMPEAVAAGVKTSAVIDRYITDRDKNEEASDAICEEVSLREQQGFIHGFRYAVKLMSDCNS